MQNRSRRSLPMCPARTHLRTRMQLALLDHTVIQAQVRPGQAAGCIRGMNMVQADTLSSTLRVRIRGMADRHCGLGHSALPPQARA